MLEEIVLANPRGYCAGVVRAVETVEKALEKYGGSVRVLHQIIHNRHVVDSLTEKGAVFVESLDEVDGDVPLILSAHGVAPSVREEAKRRNIRTIIDATCPLVNKVHSEAIRYADGGYSIILIGHRNHVEVKGTYGEAPEAITVVETVEEASRYVPIPGRGDKLVCLTQTTLSVDETKGIADALKARFPHIEFPKKDDICYATQNRQDAVKQLAWKTQLVLVVGSKNSSNSNRLVEVALGAGVEARLIDDHTEIMPEWLNDIRVVGLTAGASGPGYLVEGVTDYLRGLYPDAKVTNLDGPPERMIFGLPPI